MHRSHMRWQLSGGDPRLVEAARVVRDGLAKIDYRLIGGLALDLQGVEVGTSDVDLLVSADEFGTAIQMLAKVAQPLEHDDDTGERIPTDGDPPVYAFTGADGLTRPMSFFRVGDIDVDLVGAESEAERDALDEPPVLTTVPRGMPVAPLPAVVAIKLGAGRDKDFVQIEAVARALGKIRVKTVTAYLQKRGWDELVEEWEAAVMRATVPPRRR